VGLLFRMAGVGTHYVPYERVPGLLARLADIETDEMEVIQVAIEEYVGTVINFPCFFFGFFVCFFRCSFFLVFICPVLISSAVYLLFVYLPSLFAYFSFFSFILERFNLLFIDISSLHTLRLIFLFIHVKMGL
jgi:hypothetical protein